MQQVYILAYFLWTDFKVFPMC